MVLVLLVLVRRDADADAGGGEDRRSDADANGPAQVPSLGNFLLPVRIGELLQGAIHLAEKVAGVVDQRLEVLEDDLVVVRKVAGLEVVPAANLRAIKPPDVYKQKGVRFAGEKLRKKEGKTGK